MPSRPNVAFLVIWLRFMTKMTTSARPHSRLRLLALVTTLSTSTSCWKNKIWPLICCSIGANSMPSRAWHNVTPPVGVKNQNSWTWTRRVYSISTSRGRSLALAWQEKYPSLRHCHGHMDMWGIWWSSSCSWGWIALGIALGRKKWENSYKSIILSVFSIIFADKLDIIDAKNWYLNGFGRNLVIVMFMVMDSPWHCPWDGKSGKTPTNPSFFPFFQSYSPTN